MLAAHKPLAAYLLDDGEDLPSMLSPDAMYDRDEDHDPSCRPGTVILAGKELRQMLDIIAAVHRCWENDTLPEAVHAPYLRYSASGGALDAKGSRRLRETRDASKKSRDSVYAEELRQ